jgi:hypothetical protein
MWARTAKEGTFDAKLCSRATPRMLDDAVGTGGGDRQSERAESSSSQAVDVGAAGEGGYI